MNKEELEFLLDQLDVDGYCFTMVREDLLKYEVDMLTSDGFDCYTEPKIIYLDTKHNQLIKNPKKVQQELQLEEINTKLNDLRAQKLKLLTEMGQ